MNFTKEQIRYIHRNESLKSLEELAEDLNCTWKDIYKAYDDSFFDGSYHKYKKLHLKEIRLLKIAKDNNWIREKASLENKIDMERYAYDRKRKIKPVQI